MRTKAVSLDKLPEPSIVIQTYMDTNGNWFASIQSDAWFASTATFTEEHEAIAEALSVIKMRRNERMNSISSIVTLSTYGPKNHEIAHTVDGKPVDPTRQVSVAESLTAFKDLLQAVVKENPGIVTGQKLRVTIEPVTGS